MGAKQNNDEFWDLIDRQGNVVCKMRRGDRSAPAGLYHATVEVIPTDFAGHILVTQRDLTKRHGAGKWEFPAGSVLSGETVRHAAARELFEETGLKATKFSKIQERWVPGHRPWLPGMFRVAYFAYIPTLTTAEVTLQKGETSNYRIITLPEWYAMIGTGMLEPERTELYGQKFCAALDEKVGCITQKELPTNTKHSTTKTIKKATLK